MNEDKILRAIKVSLLIMLIAIGISICSCGSSRGLQMDSHMTITYDTTFVGSDTIVSVQRTHSSQRIDRTNLWIGIAAILTYLSIMLLTK